MSALVVRRAVAADLRRVVELAGELGYPIDAGVVGERFEKLLDEEHRALVVAELAGRVVGWLEFEVRHTLVGGTFAEIEGLVVDAGTRRSGAGRALVAWAEGEGRHRGITNLRVRSNAKREEAAVFYPALGFTLTKLQRTFDKRLH